MEYASEFRYRNPIINKGDIVIAISQSGETADTLAAIQLAKERGAIVLGICNVVGSSIPRETIAGVYTHAGPEIGVASTKAFTTQITVLTMMAMQVGLANKGLTEQEFTDLVDELYAIPQKVEQILEKSESIKQIAEKIKDATNSIYLGRGYLYPVALEGALKLKEISYIHAEGYPSAEMKHGPIALIDEKMPVIVLATKDKSYDKIVSNIQEVKARKGVVIAIVTEGDTTIKNLADYVIEVPYSDFALAPLLTVVPLQLIAYYIAVMRGCNVDQPRNLANNGDDNFTADEKSIFFSKGVIETVKKLGWSPNIVHCHGWFSALFPFIMRNVYCNDPMFANNCKVVYSIYNDSFSGSIDNGLAHKLLGKNVTPEMLTLIKVPTWDNLTKFAIDNSDGIILATKEVKPEIIQYIKDSGKPMLEYSEGNENFEDYENFYTKVSEN